MSEIDQKQSVFETESQFFCKTNRVSVDFKVTCTGTIQYHRDKVFF